MKKIVVILLFLGITISYAQVENIPQNVKNTFSQKFPSITDVSWFMGDNDEWVAEFEKENREYAVNFYKEGNWKETVYSIRFSEIPSQIRATLRKESPGYRLEDASISETEQNKVYNFQLQKGEDEVELVISFDNKVLQKK